MPVTACAACVRIVNTILREAATFGHRIAGRAEQGVHTGVCADHLPLIVATTSPKQLAAWLSSRLSNPAQDQLCFLCEAACREEAASARGEPAGVTCTRHGEPDAAGLKAIKDVLDQIASGGRLSHDREVSALRIALIRVASVRGSTVHIFRID